MTTIIIEPSISKVLRTSTNVKKMMYRQKERYTTRKESGLAELMTSKPWNVSKNLVHNRISVIAQIIFVQIEKNKIEKVFRTQVFEPSIGSKKKKKNKIQ